jgi:hypothetical protein
MTRKENAQKMLEKVESLPSFAREWGASPMASPEERAAYEFVEKRPLVESGELSARDLPEDYGGRPQGSSRRAFRMQQAWDAGYAAEMERQKQMREQAEFERQQEIRDREEVVNIARRESQIEEFRAKQKLDSEKETQRAGFDSEFSELDPRTPEFMEQYTGLLKKYPAVRLIPEIKEVTDAHVELYNVYRDTEKESALQDEERSRLGELSALEYSLKTNKPMSTFGYYDENGKFKPNIQALAVEKTKMEIEKAERDAVEPEINRLKTENSQIDDEIIQTEYLLKREKSAKLKSEYEAKLESLNKRKFNNDLNVINLDPATRDLPKVENAKQRSEIEVGESYVAITPMGVMVITKTEEEPPAQPSPAAPTQAQPTQTEPKPTTAQGQKSTVQDQERRLVELENIANDPNANFLDKAKAQADIADIKRKIEAEKARTPKIREAEQRKKAQETSAQAGASLQKELDDYYKTIFDSGSFNPTTGTPTRVKEGINAETLKQALERIKSIRVAMGEDPRNVDPELEQIYIDATR